MVEYIITYKLNGLRDNHFVKVPQTNLPFSEIKISIIENLKSNLSITSKDKLEIIDIQVYK